LVVKLKNLFYLIHRDWIIGHGSNALSDKDKAEQILLQSGGSACRNFTIPDGVNFPEFHSSENFQGVNLQEFP
jgi:hypothetical protein